MGLSLQLVSYAMQLHRRNHHCVNEAQATLCIREDGQCLGEMATCPPSLSRTATPKPSCRSSTGVLDPGDRRPRLRRSAASSAPSPTPGFAFVADVLERAALLSGLLCPLQGHAADRKVRALHDCVLFLQARMLRLTFPTGNITDSTCPCSRCRRGVPCYYRRASI
jgi:hypothetical protein